MVQETASPAPEIAVAETETAVAETESAVAETESAAPETETESKPTGVERLVVNEDGSITHATVDFEEAIASKEGIVLVDFWATWCPPCKMLAPELEQLATDYPDQITIVKIDVDMASSIAQAYEISSIPDMRIFKAGEQIDGIVGLKNAAAIADQLGL